MLDKLENRIKIGCMEGNSKGEHVSKRGFKKRILERIE